MWSLCQLVTKWFYSWIFVFADRLFFQVGFTEYKARKGWCAFSGQSPIVHRLLHFPHGSWSETWWWCLELQMFCRVLVTAGLCGLVCCCGVVHDGALVLWCDWEGIWDRSVVILKAELYGPCGRWREGEIEEGGDGVYCAKLVDDLSKMNWSWI